MQVLWLCCVCVCVQAALPGSAPVFKEGFVMRKNIMEAPHKKGVAIYIDVAICMYNLHVMFHTLLSHAKLAATIDMPQL